MTHDPLKTLLRVRKNTLEEAQRAVADAYRVERAAAARADEAGNALTRELQVATNLNAGDEAVENFARWLPVGRRALSQAHTAHREAAADLDQARAVLALARAGVRAVELLMERKAEEARLDMARREQHALDDIGSRASR